MASPPIPADGIRDLAERAKRSIRKLTDKLKPEAPRTVPHGKFTKPKKFRSWTFLVMHDICHKANLSNEHIDKIVKWVRNDLKNIKERQIQARTHALEASRGVIVPKGSALFEGGDFGQGNPDPVCGSEIRQCLINNRPALCHYTQYCPPNGDPYWIEDDQVAG